MPGLPLQWNVVVVGAWNVAILSPRGIAARLFKLAPGTPVDVQVALDQPSSLRVLHSDVAVAPSARELIVEPLKFTADGLAKAAQIATHAVQGLPETPYSAAGLNIRYSFPDTPESLLAAINSAADAQFADADFKIVSRAMKRELRFKEGVLNWELNVGDDGSCLVTFNFHRQSAVVQELAEWLAQATAMVERSKKLLTETFHLNIEDTNAE